MADPIVHAIQPDYNYGPIVAICGLPFYGSNACMNVFAGQPVTCPGCLAVRQAATLTRERDEARAALALAYPRALQAAAAALREESTQQWANGAYLPVLDALESCAVRILADPRRHRSHHEGAWRMSNPLIDVNLREGCMACPFEHAGRCLAIYTAKDKPHVRTPLEGIHERCPLEGGQIVEVRGTHG